MRDVDTSQISGRLLKVFITVFDEMSVSKAAEQLESSQSTISHNIERLRSILGDPLFLQAGRGIVPSERAEFLAPKIRHLLTDLEGLADNDGYDPLADNTPVRIASNGSTVAPQLDRLRTQLWSKVPGRQLIFRELGSRENLESVLHRGSADLAIAARPIRYPELLQCRPLFTTQSVIFYDPDERGPIKDIEEYCTAPHATLDFGGSIKSVVETALETLGLSRNISISVPNVWFLAQVLKGTNLIATLPALLKDTAFSGFSHCELPVNLPPIDFDLVWHRRNQNSPRHIWLRREAASALQQPIADPGPLPEVSRALRKPVTDSAI